jgi:hypothetical protein
MPAMLSSLISLNRANAQIPRGEDRMKFQNSWTEADQVVSAARAMASVVFKPE